MKINSLSVRFIITGVALITLLSVAGCGSNVATTPPNSNYPTSNAPITTSIPATTSTSPTTTSPATVPTTTPIPSTTPPMSTTQPPITYAFTVNIAVKTNVGNYLVTSGGLAFYYTTSDRPNYSNLPDEALTSWPVFYMPTITVGTGLNISDFGTYTRDSGKKQTTYKGYPLYLSIYDKSSGDTMGNALGGVWFVVKP